MKLAGKNALVTGASRGLGRAIAFRLAQDGAAVAANYARRADEVESLVSEIRGFGGRAVSCQFDVADYEQVKRAVDQTVAELGPIDVLVNNAGILYRADLEQYDPALNEELYRVNVGGVINTTAAVAESMKARRFGRIVNISSIAAFGTSLPGTTFYAGSKAAVVALTRRFALDLGSFGITVNAIAPGFVATDMVSGGQLESIADKLAAITMVRRIGKPEEIAHAVSFLASPESGFITAQTLTVDGGRMDFIGHP